MYDELIWDYLKTSAEAVGQLGDISEDIAAAANIIIRSIREEGKIIIFGNGGSAADSQHFATELVARFRKDRPSLNAVALTTNSSMLTAIGNDDGFRNIFKRQVEAIGRRGDAAVAISTSGNSENILEGARAAKEAGLKIIAFTGAAGGELAEIADVSIKPASGITSHVQECHLIAYHLICYIIEEELF
ncbi:MAG: SIS domain-containing protein [Elusimicrobiota bacterium]|nr:SIS domain-containing protein [Elusimicrobiota bacterium]